MISPEKFSYPSIMEFLFMGQWASTEAVLVLLSVGVFVAIFLYDGFLYLRNVLHVFWPKKDTETPLEPETIWVMTAMPVVAENIQADGENIQKPEETPEQKEEESPVNEESPINNDDLMEINIGGDIGEVTPKPEATTPQEEKTEESILPLELAIETPPAQAEESPLITADESSLVGEPAPIVESIPEEAVTEPSAPTPQEEPEVIPEEISSEPTTEQEPLPTPEATTENKEESPRTNHTETLFALVNNVRTLIARGQTLEARGLIIQWLALDKENRELNLMLALLYEQDHHFEKAEYIYKDLALTYPNDIEILEKLGNVLIIERRYEIALEMYKKILGLTGETEGTLYILTHLSSELGQHELAYTYGKRYQKQWPNNPEILTIISQMEVALGKRQDAIQTLIKLKNLTPYNQEIADMIQKLVLEEELAGNFGGEKVQ